MAADDWFSSYQLPVQQWVESLTQALSSEIDQINKGLTPQPDKLTALNLTPTDVINQLSNQNIQRFTAIQAPKIRAWAMTNWMLPAPWRWCLAR